MRSTPYQLLIIIENIYQKSKGCLYHIPIRIDRILKEALKRDRRVKNPRY